MLDQLAKLVSQHAGEAIVNNQAIPNQYNEAAIQEVADSIVNTMKGQVAQGNLQQVISLFQNGAGTNSISSNPMVRQMITTVAGNFASRFGLSAMQAERIVSDLLPTVMSQFINKTNDPRDDAFDLTSMMQSMSGNSNLDVAGLISQMAGNKGNPFGTLGDLANKLFGK